MRGRRREVDGEETGPTGPSPEAAPFAALAEATGAAWFEDEAVALRAAGRPLVGGWPGTVSEARTRVMNGVARARGSVLSREATAELAHVVYITARRRWEARATREPPEPT